MRARNFAWPILFGSLLVTGGASVSRSAQETAPSAAVPVSLLVSVEARHGKDVPTINREDVRVLQGKNRLEVTGWVPLENAQAELELCILIDEAANPSLGLQFDDLREFIDAQPATTAIAVGYMRNGTVDLVQNFTKDHAQAAKALRLPFGSAGGAASPYLSVSDLIKRWPDTPARREIFMISDGIDRLQGGPNDSYLAEAIDRARRAGVQIYTIYSSGSGHFGHSFFRVNWGQNNLSQLADQTGGEAYFQGFQTPIAFAPFLKEFADRLKHQYRLTFLAKPGRKSGFQQIKLETEVPNAELVAADKVYVPAAK
jgi:VWFA-related protein